jgi:hypothetical protein
VKRSILFVPFGGAGGGAPAPTPDANKASDATSPAKTGLIAAVTDPTETAAPQGAKSDSAALNLSTVVSVPWVIGLALMLVQWGILRGTR